MPYSFEGLSVLYNGFALGQRFNNFLFVSLISFGSGFSLDSLYAVLPCSLSAFTALPLYSLKNWLSSSSFWYCSTLSIKSLYSSAGFNSVEVEVKTKKISENSLDVLVEVDRGEKTKISSIKFIGNNKVSSKRLRDVTASEKHRFWKILSRNTNFTQNILDLDTRLLKNYYRSIGFYDVNINSKMAKIKKDGKAEIIYSIDEGKRYTINKISTNVDKVFDKQLFFPLKQTYQKYIGEYYSPFKVKNILEDLDKLIDDNNLQFVEHNVQEIIEGNSINIIFNIFEGKKILVERINVLGNTITNEDVIRGELILDEGDQVILMVYRNKCIYI